MLSRVKTGGRIYTIYTSNDADSPKDVPIVFRVSISPKHHQSGHGSAITNKPKVRKIEIAIYHAIMQFSPNSSLIPLVFAG